MKTTASDVAEAKEVLGRLSDYQFLEHMIMELRAEQGEQAFFEGQITQLIIDRLTDLATYLKQMDQAGTD